MKVRLVLTYDVDEKAWANEFGVAEEDVRDDVRIYFSYNSPEHYLVADGTVRDVIVR